MRQALDALEMAGNGHNSVIHMKLAHDSLRSALDDAKLGVDEVERLEKSLAESQAREARLREALNTALSCADGYYVPALKKEFALADNEPDDTALKEYKRKVLLDAADWFESAPVDYAFAARNVLKGMAEEV